MKQFEVQNLDSRDEIGIKLTDRGILATFEDGKFALNRLGGSNLASGRPNGKNWILGVIRVVKPTTNPEILHHSLMALALPFRSYGPVCSTAWPSTIAIYGIDHSQSRFNRRKHVSPRGPT